MPADHDRKLVPYPQGLNNLTKKWVEFKDGNEFKNISERLLCELKKSHLKTVNSLPKMHIHSIQSFLARNNIIIRESFLAKYVKNECEQRSWPKDPWVQMRTTHNGTTKESANQIRQISSQNCCKLVRAKTESSLRSKAQSAERRTTNGIGWSSQLLWLFTCWVMA